MVDKKKFESKIREYSYEIVIFPQGDFCKEL